MLKANKLLIFTFLLLIPLPITAQTSSELRQKYKVSTLVESYEVRLGIIATVSFGESGLAESILIRPRPTFDREDHSKTEMPYKIIEEILNELVPVTSRGKLYQDVGPVSGRNYYRYENYENADISSKIHNFGVPTATVSQVYVVLKKTYRH